MHDIILFFLQEYIPMQHIYRVKPCIYNKYENEMLFHNRVSERPGQLSKATFDIQEAKLFTDD